MRPSLIQLASGLDTPLLPSRAQFGRRRVKRKSAHARVYGDFSRTRPKGLTKAIVSKARKCKLKVTRKMGNRRVYKKLSVIKSQIRRKETAARKRRKRTGGDMRRRRCTGFGKRRRKRTYRRGRVTSATCRKRRRSRYGIALDVVGGNVRGLGTDVYADYSAKESNPLLQVGGRSRSRHSGKRWNFRSFWWIGRIQPQPKTFGEEKRTQGGLVVEPFHVVLRWS